MRAVVLGGAECTWSDFDELGRDWPDVVVATNHAGIDYEGRIDHWVTLHVEHLQGWMEEREARGLNMDFETWTRPKGRAFNQIADHYIKQWGGGSSGMFGVQVALDRVGCDMVALCGCPIDNSRHYHDRSQWGDGGWPDHTIHRKAWIANLERMEGKVFSMSGWTRELLGGPECAALAT